MKLRTLIKIVIALTTFVCLPQVMYAAGKVKTNPYLDWAYENIILVIALLVLGVVAAIIWNLMEGLVEYQKREFLEAKGVHIDKKKVEKDSFLRRLYDKSWSLVPMDKEQDIDLGHDYDGIRELDNRLPPWWVYSFYLTILLSIGYIYVYHYSDIGMNQQEEYDAEMEIGEKQMFEFNARQANGLDENNLVASVDEADLAIGKDIFIVNCSACHGVEGQGGVGPNLTDKYWVHEGNIKSIYLTIKNGVPEKGMIAWKTQLKPETILKIASYVKTLAGTNPPNPKEPQGDLYEEEQVLNATIDK